MISPARQSEAHGSAIVVRGARQNNLQDVDVTFPRGRLSVVTGVSGSGKSSLALDTVYAEGQRRYVASLSTYAQQFLDRLPRPDVESIEGLPPAIAIEQKNQTLSRRSTVGTASEIYDLLRLLYARVGVPHCPDCDVPVRSWSPTAVAAAVAAAAEGTDWTVTFELPVSEALTHAVLVENLRSLGFIRLLAGGEERHLEELGPDADLTTSTPLFVVVDRVRAGRTTPARIAEAIERAYEEGEGEAVLFRRRKTGAGSGDRYSRQGRCRDCGFLLPDLRPSLFSFNSPHGACPGCNGFGWLLEYDPARIVPDPDRSLADGALDPWTKPRYGGRRERLRRFALETGIPWRDPWASLPGSARKVLLHGGRYAGRSFEGALPFLRRLEAKRYKAYIRFFLRSYQSYRLCPDCEGSRLRPAAAAVRVAGETLPTVSGWTLGGLHGWIEGMGSDAAAGGISAPILRELRRRTAILLQVGLDYMTLDRHTRTLSGGEAQRIAIANALGSALTDGLYVLDEPTIGLHARDTGRLLDLLRELARRENTVLVVEHDLEVVREADRVVELGPGSGAAGGQVVFAGTPEALERADTRTGRWLRGEATLPARKPRALDGPWLEVHGARAHNLRGIDVAIPLRALTAVTGVSGSGKSSLVHDVIGRALSNGRPGAEGPNDALGGPTCDRVVNAEWVSEVIGVDASPIGKSPRSNPVTYVQAFEPIRRLFADSQPARRRGLGPGHFSFNTASGRCPACRGDGHERVEMVFLPDVFVRCEACGGRRYRPEVRAVRWRGRSIDEVLELTVDEALSFFAGEPRVGRGLRVLQAVGLGYLALGQPATTLSGGESQRLKLARELARRPRGRPRGRGILYLLDEPTNGLHHDDVRCLVRVLDELVGRGHTVIVIEHHLDLIARADWIVDLGPEGGPRGGRIVVAGPPARVAECETSHTGRALAPRREREAVPV